MLGRRPVTFRVYFALYSQLCPALLSTGYKELKSYLSLQYTSLHAKVENLAFRGRLFDRLGFPYFMNGLDLSLWFLQGVCTMHCKVCDVKVLEQIGLKKEN